MEYINAVIAHLHFDTVVLKNIKPSVVYYAVIGVYKQLEDMEDAVRTHVDAFVHMYIDVLLGVIRDRMAFSATKMYCTSLIRKLRAAQLWEYTHLSSEKQAEVTEFMRHDNLLNKAIGVGLSAASP